MGTIKQINIKNRTYYFYNDIIDLENFDSSLLKLDKKSYKDISIHNIGYITILKIANCKNIYSMNPLYLRITHASGYIEEENENKYLIFDSRELHSVGLRSINKNKELLKKYNNVFNEIRVEIKEINSDDCDYEKDYIKIKFNSDDNLLLNKLLNFHNMTITIRFVFEEDDKLYPQVFLDDTLYKLSI